MAGREGLVDTACKTSRSGYLQRCLVKGLETLQVQYDNTVRDCNQNVIQFIYGEDSLDVTKSSYLDVEDCKNFKFFVDNRHCIQHTLKSTHFNSFEIEQMKKFTNETNSKKNINMDVSANVRKFNEFEFEKAQVHMLRWWKQFKKLEKQKNKVSKYKLWKMMKNFDKMYDPVLLSFSPHLHFGSVSELFFKKVKNFIKQTSSEIDSKKKNARFEIKYKISSKDFEQLMKNRYMQSLVEAGEMVGILAAQSIGEPSTQMTLNTFHLAGFGERNVTLGIPRMREILMTDGRSIKTPDMRFYIHKNSLQPMEDAIKLKTALTPLPLSNVCLSYILFLVFLSFSNSYWSLDLLKDHL